jgi:hypothetical protein
MRKVAFDELATSEDASVAEIGHGANRGALIDELGQGGGAVFVHESDTSG